MMIQDCENQSGLLSQIDPRLKLLLAVAAIAAVFSTKSWLLLVLIGFLSGYLLSGLGVVDIFRQRIFWLRWFFLFVMILHLFLSPGYRLLGQAWLSLDGLWQGMFVSTQVIIALALSLLLTRSTTPEKLAAATASLLSPLNIVGLNINGFARQVLLTLDFVPVLQSEGEVIAEKLPGADGYTARLSRLRKVVVGQFESLVDKADALAHQRARGERTSPDIEPLTSFWPLTHADWISVLAIFTLIAFMAGLP